MKRLRNDGKTETQFTMRLETAFYEQVKASAVKNKRSIAKEIEFALEQYLNKQN